MKINYCAFSLIIGGHTSHVLFQGVLQRDRTVILLQKISEGFISKILKVLHRVLAERPQGGPCFVINLAAFPRRNRRPEPNEN
jgi:hypothetical protein